MGKRDGEQVIKVTAVEEKEEDGTKDNIVEEDTLPQRMEEGKALDAENMKDINGEEGQFDGSRTGNKGMEPEQRTPDAATRPVRERKSVERLIDSVERDSSTSMGFSIEKGQGTRLKDIPNVAHKLRKRKNDDLLKLLYNILFSRRGKAAEIKKNISCFSGFVWKDNEEQQMTKLKEKLGKCVKEKLWQLCDLLDIPVTKTTTKKQEMITKLMDFLVAPHASTTKLLAEREQTSKEKKRKRGSKSGESSSDRSVKEANKEEGKENSVDAHKRKSGKNAKTKVKYEETEPSSDQPREEEPSADQPRQPEAAEPTDDELRKAIHELLKVVDFNTTTFYNVTDLLGRQFNQNLHPRKYFIRDTIHAELDRIIELEKAADAEAKADDEGDGSNDGNEV